MSVDLIRYSASGGIAELMLDRAPVNALSMPLIEALLAALAKARDDEAVRAVIIACGQKIRTVDEPVGRSASASLPGA